MTPEKKNDMAAEVRAWMRAYHGTDYDVPDDVLRVCIERAQAKRELLGYGSVFVMVADMLKGSGDAP